MCRRWQAGLLARLRQTRVDPGGGASRADLGAAQASAGERGARAQVCGRGQAARHGDVAPRAPPARQLRAAGRLRGVPRPRPPWPPSARPPQSLSGRLMPKTMAHQAGCRTLSQTRLARKQTQAFGMARSSCT